MKYVIVVHGIGEQRKNKTALDVINRFSEARRSLPANEKDMDILTLGKATGQTGTAKDPWDTGVSGPDKDNQPWIEFDGIPQEPAIDQASLDALRQNPFFGERSVNGENIRFVDLNWADICQKNFKEVGQEVEPWANSLLGRLLRKDKIAEDSNLPKKRVPWWIIDVLDNLAQTLKLLRKSLSWKASNLSDLIFNKFLGDVQLYGEYSYCRGEAVQRFHKVMHKIEEAHNEQEEKRKEESKTKQTEFVADPPEYTVIAHSLGTVMSMDALLYALAKPEIRQSDTPSETDNLPFAGYHERIPHKASGQYISYWNTDWIERIESFVTLGSPIDKVLTMWWTNYQYLLTDDWMDPARKEKVKIRHLNYSDEQDPVGHNLDFAYTAPVFRKIFKKEDDHVFVRYPVPGAAHNAYWKDLALFKWIINKTVDADTPNPVDKVLEPDWFDKTAYKKVLFYNYYLVPILVISLDFFAFTFAVRAESFHSIAMATLVFVGACYLGRKILDLIIQWRQVLRTKSSAKWEKCVKQKISNKITSGYEERKSESGLFAINLKKTQNFIRNASLISTVLYFYLCGAMKAISSPENAKAVLPIGNLSLILVLSVLTIIFWRKQVWHQKGLELFAVSQVDRVVCLLVVLPSVCLALLSFSLGYFWHPFSFSECLLDLGVLLFYAISFSTISFISFAYLSARFKDVKTRYENKKTHEEDALKKSRVEFNFSDYAN